MDSIDISVYLYHILKLITIDVINNKCVIKRYCSYYLPCYGIFA